MATTMRIFVKMVMEYSSSYWVDLRDDDGVQGLRQEIFRIRDIPLERQLLSFAGEQLEDGRLLSYYGIVDLSLIHI